MTDHYTFLKTWLRAKWKNLPDEQVQMMLQSANAIESLELDNFNLRKELRHAKAARTQATEASHAQQYRDDGGRQPALQPRP
jgi:uncharacterized protein YpuA (DUF1002 family)